MSASVVSGVVNSVDASQRNITLYGELSVAAGDYAADGLEVDISGFDFGPAGICPPIGPPVFVSLQSQPVVADAAAGMYVYQWLQGSALSDGQMQIFTGAAANSALTELATAATPAGVVADVIRFQMVCPRQ